METVELYTGIVDVMKKVSWILEFGISSAYGRCLPVFTCVSVVSFPGDMNQAGRQ